MSMDTKTLSMQKACSFGIGKAETQSATDIIMADIHGRADNVLFPL